jgi:hypothetical protein
VTKKRYYYLGLAVASVVYVAASLFAPLGPNRFNLTNSKTHVLQLSLLLPIVVIWWIAAYGAERFKRYTTKIKSHKDGRALDKISTGLIILVLSIVLNSMFGVLRGWAVQNGWLAAFTNLSNHLAVVGPLIAYGFMWRGSEELKALVKKPKSDTRNTLLLFLLLAIIAVIYTVTVTNYAYLDSTPDSTRYSSFYSSAPLVLLTIALPYLISWGLGFKTALNLVEYRSQVKGAIYRAMLFRLVVGVLIVVGFYFVVQLLFAFSTFFARAGLGSILLVIYLLIIGYAAGFLVIASGAKKLANIEQV